MKQKLHHHLYSVTTKRGFATKYSGRVVNTTENGRTIAVEVDAPKVLQDVKGYLLPRRDLICKITKIIQSSSPSIDPYLELSDYFETLTLNLTPSEVSEILKSIQTPRKALEFFQFCSTSIPDFRHDCFTYNRILSILSKSSAPGALELVKRIVDEMEKNGVKGSISTVNILVGIFGSGGEGVVELERCLRLVKKWDLKFNCYTYKCVLQAYLRSNEVEKAFDVYMEMRRRAYALDIFAYNMLLDALAKDEKVEQAYKVFTDMKRKHCEPDEYTYTIMIRMIGKTGKADECLALFQEMITKGCALSLIAYNTMIQALARNRMVDKVISLFSKMIKNNCPPNEFTYSVILDVLVVEGKLGKLDEVVEVSKKYMNKSIYAYLVKTLTKLGHASEAHRLFCNMWIFHDKGDRDAYMSMLESLCDSGRTAEALDLLSKIHEKGISTNTVMYNMVFAALGKFKEISHIQDLYEKMKQSGPLPDIFTYNILISSYGRGGRVDEAVQVFEEMEKGNCQPDVITYNSLINCLGKNGNVDEAHMRFKEMQEKGLNPDVITYSTLIECFGKTSKVEMACTLFDQMLAEGCFPNIVTYNILLDCLEKCGKATEALELYVKLKQQGLTPDSITYTVLERLQSGSRKTVRIRKQNPITGWVVSPLSKVIWMKTQYATSEVCFTLYCSLYHKLTAFSLIPAMTPSHNFHFCFEFIEKHFGWRKCLIPDTSAAAAAADAHTAQLHCMMKMVELVVAAVPTCLRTRLAFLIKYNWKGELMILD
ncbi:Pentatricopeptide repeat-containing protein [Thalictrum thalictroides]|uniref:Pentatricopeptide repeat-containing protein n=1 Tax=Thalictrum thalictroides TaxID=46969 RepID=A0A7J6WES9_THATH|nr:Pentatricopeptide repeat-containing protein [Thalictrum thalictroides]